jgi:hypothetical protein
LKALNPPSKEEKKMKTLFNDFVAIILAVVFSTTMINSQTALLVSSDAGDMYAATLNAEAYTILSQALGNSQPLYF